MKSIMMKLFLATVIITGYAPTVFACVCGLTCACSGMCTCR